MLQLAFLLLVTGHRQSPRTVTYTNNGARIEVILPELSKLTGLTLKASKEMADRVLILRLDQAPVDEVTRRIAGITLGRWENGEDGTRFLSEDPARVAQEAAAVARQLLLRTIASLADIGKPGHFVDDAKLSEQLDDPSLLPGVLSQLSQQVDPAELAELRPGRCIVFSTAPTRLQRPLAPGDSTLIQGLLRHRTHPSASFSNSALPPDATDFGKADLIAFQVDGEVRFDLRIFSRQSHRLFTDTFYPSAVRVDNLRFDPDLVKKANDDSPIEATKPLKDLMTARQNKAGLSPDLATELQDPVHFDPSSFGGGLVVSLADRLHVQLVAAPDDGWINELWEDAGYGASPSSIERSIETRCEIEDGGEDGWIELAGSRYPLPGEPRTIDRRTLAKLVRTSVSNPGMDLPDLIKVWRDGIERVSFLPQYLLESESLGTASFEDNALLDLMAKLSDDEIEELLKGQKLRLGQCSPGFQAAFTEFATGNRERTFDARTSAPRDDDEIDGCVDGFVQTSAGQKSVPPYDSWTVYSEDADSFCPPDCLIELRCRSHPLLVFDEKLGFVPLAPDIAVHEFGAGLKAQKVGVCLSKEYNLTMTFAPKISFWDGGYFTVFPVDFALGTFASLPADLKTELSKLIDAREAAAAKEHSTAGGAGPP